MPIIIDM